MDMKALRRTFLNGIFNENPTFRLVLGMCPTLAITYQASNGIGMGLATTFVLVFSNLVISLLRNAIPGKVRIPAFIVIIATFVTVVEMVLHAFLPSLYDTLGVFIPLIVVNCIIFARAEAFAFKNPRWQARWTGWGWGWGLPWRSRFCRASGSCWARARFSGRASCRGGLSRWRWRCSLRAGSSCWG